MRVKCSEDEGVRACVRASTEKAHEQCHGQPRTWEPEERKGAHEEEETPRQRKWDAGGSCRVEEDQKAVFSGGKQA